MIFIYSDEYLESYEERLVYYIWLSMVFGYGTEKTLELAARYKSIYELWQACRKNKSVIAEDKKSAFETITYDDAMELVKRMYSQGIEITVDGDENYPKKLLKYKNRPILLFYRGDISIIDTCYCVAVVGTRKPDTVGEHDAREISASFAGRDFAVVSGFADGIDRAAHKGTVDAGGRTVSILGGAIEGVADSNKSLEKKISESGVVMSEIPVSESAFRSGFINRNRITAMVSECAVVIQAGKHSGTLDCTRKFLGLLKPVYFMLPHGENAESEDYYGGIRYVSDSKGGYSYYHKFNLLREFNGIEPILENANRIKPFYDDYSGFCQKSCNLVMTDEPFFAGVYQPSPASVICERLGSFQRNGFNMVMNYNITAVGLPPNAKAYSFIERLKSGGNNYLDVEYIPDEEKESEDMPMSVRSFKQHKAGADKSYLPIDENILLRDKFALESIRGHICNQKTRKIALKLNPPVKELIEIIKLPNPFDSAYIRNSGGAENYSKNASKAAKAIQKRFDSLGMQYSTDTAISDAVNAAEPKITQKVKTELNRADSENTKQPDFGDESMNAVYLSICKKPHNATLQDIQTATGISVADIQTAILMLEMQGYVTKSTKGFGYDRLK